MFIEVVHVNGCYSPAKGEHETPVGMPEGYFEKLASVLAQAASKGSSLVYRPNLYSFTHDLSSTGAEHERALTTDPFLSIWGNTDGLTVLPDISGLAAAKEAVALEDELVRKHGQAAVLGAYTKWCVAATAHNIASRNPGRVVYIDPDLSIDNCGSYIDAAGTKIPHASVARITEEEKIIPNIVYQGPPQTAF